MRRLDLDAERFGTSKWNPLRMIAAPGHTVVIKPNAVWDVNLKVGQSIFASITHGSVLRAILDYVYKAIDGSGRIIIADCPIMHSDFGHWRKVCGIDEIVDFYRDKLGFDVEVYDCRRLIAPWDFDSHYAPAELRRLSNGDPSGHKEIDLASNSAFASLPDGLCRLLYGSDYHRENIVANHTGGRHRYCVAGTFLKADAIISVPKMKVHSKVGVTVSMKGFVGTQGDKNYLPHLRIGPPSRGGDEYPDTGILQDWVNRYRMWLLCNVLSREKSYLDWLYRTILQPAYLLCDKVADRLKEHEEGVPYVGNILGGSWFGNDTAWRMSLDLTRLALYADADGHVADVPCRSMLIFVDGILAGQAQGPLAPDEKKCGIVLCGRNPLSVDIAAARIMGFDPMKIPLLREGLKQLWLRSGNETEQTFVCSEGSERELSALVGLFKPPRGWIGHIEA